jgi:hypothetical protein
MAYGRNNVDATRIFIMNTFAVSSAPKPEKLLHKGKEQTVLKRKLIWFYKI